MTEKRCTDCKYTRGIGFDFWCGEGHTEYEVFGGTTNCPYYEYHDWSKGTPSRLENKRFVKYNGNTIVDLKLVKSWIISNGNIDLLLEILNDETSKREY